MNRTLLPVIPQRPTSDLDRARAACRDTDPQLFYSDNKGDKQDAKAICRGCDIRNECLEYALGFDDRWGVWGGLEAGERWELLKRRRALV
jgi:WhiB family redox-sensing transcriptional regulator